MSDIGMVYPRSVTEGFQTGEMTVIGKAMIIWHYCGFAHILSSCDADSLDQIYDIMTKGDRRMVLFTDSADIVKYLKGKGAKASTRIFYEYGGDTPDPDSLLPEGFAFREMDSELIDRLEGRIVPSFSWDDKEKFLASGKGFCVMHGDTPASWAFSAAVCSTQTDIGVETAPDWQKRGLAVAAAVKMAEYVKSQGKTPVWACNEENIASARTAEKAGFIKAAECTILTK